MEYLIQFQINIFAFMILGALYVFVRLSKVESFSKKLIRVTIIATSIAVVFEPLSWIFDDETISWAYPIEYATNFMLFLLATMIGGLLIAYVDYRVHRSPQRIYKRLWYQQGTILNLIILIINIFKPIYFYVVPLTNSYRTGPYIALHYLIIIIIYLYMLFTILKNVKSVSWIESVIFSLFFLIPVVGMVVNIFSSKIHLTWTSIVFILLVMYIFLETTSTEEDYLTKLYNRASYESYLRYLKESKKQFGVIIIDLNAFKLINDQYGHKKGDEVLIAFAAVLKIVFHKEKAVARLGGDEFSVILEEDMDCVSDCMKRVEELLNSKIDPVIQSLKFSYGYEGYNESLTLDEIFIAADKKMYEQKAMQTK